MDTPERLIKAFNYRDWYCSYDVELFRKGLPGHILEELIAPDILLSDLNGCRKILRNAKRFLNGHTKPIVFILNMNGGWGLWIPHTQLS
ncbi:hypothetical protein [Klebsiella pneumoniae]|uniref:hypothetical protein n=1 Tax=Klebsiella pneumoniae TaxID=573 RepID=UPI001E306C80